MTSNTPADADNAASTPSADTSAAPEQATTAEAKPDMASTAARLAELFPALFSGQPKPLKLRIQVDIQERAPGVFTKQTLSAFFRRYTGATSYLIAVTKAKQRFDLDGQPAGELTDEHRKVAADELTRRRSLSQARREQEQGERRQRAQLLRDFETTKLTTANFCALKGIAAEALDGVLAQARAEALEDAQRPQRPQHERHGRGEGRGDHRGEGRHGQGPRRDAQGEPRGKRPDGQKGPRGPRPEGARPPRRPA